MINDRVSTITEEGPGTIRATLPLLSADEGGRQSAFSGDGRLNPPWDIDHRTAAGQQALNIARLWVEFAPQLGPGETADVRLAPLCPERWQHLKPGDVITMHEAQPAAGIAETIEVLPPHVRGRWEARSEGPAGRPGWRGACCGRLREQHGATVQPGSRSAAGDVSLAVSLI
ncbi:hypothetical protein [Streptomyces sp. NPDC058739]|uniref:hypothetical protein n=1 Tax=Streptomyces sp. NPDC058739 TaxID=3346618 RepID=UPI0036D1E934